MFWPLFYWGCLYQCSLWRLACHFPFLDVSLSGFWMSSIIEWVGQCSFPFYSWKSLWSVSISSSWKVL
jgi:hypothetical protein